MEKVNLDDKLALFTERWSPKIVGELNGQQVKLVKLQGFFAVPVKVKNMGTFPVRAFGIVEKPV
jgi:kynurenine formamidase